ncbi:HEPN domain-containing protein [Methylomagnum sp.]
MTPQLEEARRALRMADKDIAVFDYILDAPGISLSIIGFHAQQAVEKSLKAVLFAHSVGFGRTHDLAQLGRWLSEVGIALPMPIDALDRLIPMPSSCAMTMPK